MGARTPRPPRRRSEDRLYTEAELEARIQAEKQSELMDVLKAGLERTDKRLTEGFERVEQMVRRHVDDAQRHIPPGKDQAVLGAANQFERGTVLRSTTKTVLAAVSAVIIAVGGLATIVITTLKLLKVIP